MCIVTMGGVEKEYPKGTSYEEIVCGDGTEPAAEQCLSG